MLYAAKTSVCRTIYQPIQIKEAFDANDTRLMLGSSPDDGFIGFPHGLERVRFKHAVTRSMPTGRGRLVPASHGSVVWEMHWTAAHGGGILPIERALAAPQGNLDHVSGMVRSVRLPQAWLKLGHRSRRPAHRPAMRPRSVLQDRA